MVSLIRPDYVKDGASVIEYHIFDCIIPGVDSGYTNRKNFLDELISNISNPIVNVETICVNDETELMEAFEHFVSEGYEGAIVRNASGKYVNKRSYDLQKIKEFQDAEFEIVDVEQGRGKMVGRAIFVCLADPNNDLSRFNVKMEGSLDNLTDIFTNRADYIGKQLTVRYQALTAYGIPRFPIGVSVRDYE
jgi:DNA ligase-1